MDPETLYTEYTPVHPLRNGQFVYVRSDGMGPDAPVPETVVVAGECRITGDLFILEGVPLRGLSDWYGSGVAIQDALPTLTPQQREFLKTGNRPGALGGGSPASET